MRVEIDNQAEKFAQRITELAQAFGGNGIVPFRSDVIYSGKTAEQQSWRIDVGNESYIPLYTGGKPTFRITASWICSAGADGNWLRVDKSKFHVFMESNERKPMFRYEFDNSVGADLPQAHIHFHNEHLEMGDNPSFKQTEDALGSGGDGSRRSRKRTHNKLSNMHFPVGGPRFRPALEDILKTMIEEYGVEPQGCSMRECKNLLARNILNWRKTQVRAVVRDMPSEAVASLEACGYKVTPPDSGLRPDSPEKLALH